MDVSSVFIDSARERAKQLGVEDKVRFVHGDAAGYVAPEQVEVAACLGATWIGGGAAGTVELLRQSLVPSGIVLIGEPGLLVIRVCAMSFAVIARFIYQTLLARCPLDNEGMPHGDR